MRIPTGWLALLLYALLSGCAVRTTPQRLAADNIEVPAITTLSSNLKFFESYPGHICQVGTVSCLSMDSRPFAPCWVTAHCSTQGEMIQAVEP